MDLWTEFEGVTIDSCYSLNRLLQTEGRSAFFSTLNANGDAVLIRIIECHFDEDEIQARWRGVEMLGHPAFLRIDRFGQFLIEEDEITAVYAVFERVDENLAHVLERGRLSAADATQIGRSVASALETLHANGFVHEHVEARNIYAVGETVKMRSDCVRETPEGEAGIEARRRDVQDLAVLLTQVLEGMGGAGNGRGALPAPFDEIVRNGMSGEWGLKEIQRALTPAVGEKNGHRQARKAAEPVGMSEAAAAPKPAQNATADSAATATPERRSRLADDPEAETPLLGQRRAPMEELPVIFGISQQDMRRWMTVGGALLALVLLIAFVANRWTAGHAQGSAAAPGTASTQRPQIAARQASSSPTAAQPQPNPTRDGAWWHLLTTTRTRRRKRW